MSDVRVTDTDPVSIGEIMGRLRFDPPREVTPEQIEARAQAEREREAREAAERVKGRERDWIGLVGKRYAWARPGAPELAARCYPRRTGGAAATPQEAIDAILAHAGNVVLVGLPGSGKTSLLCAALRVRDDAERAEWRTRRVMLGAYELGSARIQHPAGQGESPMVEAACSASLLLLDDLGNERQTATNAVPDVIQSRHHDDLPTWFTTGETREQIASKYGGGVMRRVFDGALVIEMRREAK